MFRDRPGLSSQGRENHPRKSEFFSIGAIHLNFTVMVEDRQTADEIVHVLKYELSGALKDAIRKAAGRS